MLLDRGKLESALRVGRVADGELLTGGIAALVTATTAPAIGVPSLCVRTPLTFGVASSVCGIGSGKHDATAASNTTNDRQVNAILIRSLGQRARGA